MGAFRGCLLPVPSRRYSMASVGDILLYFPEGFDSVRNFLYAVLTELPPRKVVIGSPTAY